MTFISGTLLIDAPASALNNSGESIPGARLQENTSATKYIQMVDGKQYPYVSAQAVRYWLRRTLEETNSDWQSWPAYRDNKVAYTDGNPIKWWDDDLLGYMRAPATKNKKDRQSDPEYQKLTQMELNDKNNEVTITRAAPFRLGTFVSTIPTSPVNEFGVMARHEGDPVPYEQQFYRAILQGLFSLDLGMAGKFYYRRRTGYQNLDAVRRQIAKDEGLTHLEDEKAYQFPVEARVQRIQALLNGLGQLQGGAKQSTHYTDVSPAVVIAAVTKGGNHPFNYLFGNGRTKTDLNEQVLVETITLCQKHKQLLSPVYIGWKPGFEVASYAKLNDVITDDKIADVPVTVTDPLDAFLELGTWLEENTDKWDI